MLSKVTPSMISALGYKIFLMFAAINIGGMATFAAYVFLPHFHSGAGLIHYILD